MSRKSDCIFCQLVAVEISANVIYENEAVLAFLDVGPLADGHVLLIPRHHFAHIGEMPAAEAAQLAAVLPRLARALLHVTEAEGLNILQNNGASAGQVVEHVHFHLIPRRSGDGLGYRWNARAYPPGRASELATTYQRTLAAMTD